MAESDFDRDDPAEIGEPKSANGTPANGTSANGTSANGTPANGTSANGTSRGQPDSEAAADPSLPTDGEFEDEAEFSLEDLSKAYAKILSDQRGESAEDDLESTPGGVATEEDDGREDRELLDDARDNAGSPISETSIVEALLFVGVHEGQKLSSKRIASAMRDISPAEVKEIIRELNRRYEEDGNPYRIVFESGGYRMNLADSFTEVRERFYGEVKEAELNQNAIDVLSVVAYHQPITKPEIDRIRQKPSGSLVNQLVHRQLLAETGDGEGQAESSKVKSYGTTERFLQLLGLESLDDLPLAQEVDDIDEFFDGDPLA